MAGDRWKLVSHWFRYKNLGDKRNAAMALTSPDVDAYAIWDDDDIYLPHQLSALVASLQDAQWAQPSQALVAVGKRFRRVATFNERAPHNYGYPGGWGFRREAFYRLGGYNAISNGEDQELAERARKLLGPSADTLCDQYPTPGYVFTQDGQHLSSMGPGEEGYCKLGKQTIKPVDKLDISWPEDYCAWPIGDKVSPRKW